MIPDLNFFNGNTSREYEGRMYYRSFSPFDKCGKYELIFRNVTMNSSYEQVILVGLYSFAGSIRINGEPVKLRKSKHDGFFLYGSDADSNGCIHLLIDYRGGTFFIQNDMLGWSTDITFQRKELVNTAMIGEKLNDNTYRFYCNDKEYDDDFDDLIFEMEIREIN